MNQPVQTQPAGNQSAEVQPAGGGPIRNVPVQPRSADIRTGQAQPALPLPDATSPARAGSDQDLPEGIRPEQALAAEVQAGQAPFSTPVPPAALPATVAAGSGGTADDPAASPARRPAPLPGDPSLHERVERMIRVDHAGEYGAARIYAGQLAILGRGDKGDLLRHMEAQEKEHLRTFSGMIADRRVRPTALLPLWHVAGFALGAMTAALGSRAAMACTVAVEEAIDEHYAGQAATLPAEEDGLRGVIERFRAEELEHRDIGLEHEAELAPGYRLLSAAIKAGCKVAIAVSERI